MAVSSLDVIALSLIFICVIAIILGIIKIHNLPGKVARSRHHPQAEAIHICSLLGLIAFPLWMFAMIWAYFEIPKVPITIIQNEQLNNNENIDPTEVSREVPVEKNNSHKD